MLVVVVVVMVSVISDLAATTVSSLLGAAAVAAAAGAASPLTCFSGSSCFSASLAAPFSAGLTVAASALGYKRRAQFRVEESSTRR